MTLARKTIRDRFVFLLSGATAASTRVYGNRFHPEHTLPVIRVMTNESARDVERSTLDYTTIRETVQVECIDKDGTSVEDDLDAMEAAINSLLLADPGLGIGMQGIEWEGSSLEPIEDFEEPTAVRTITFTVYVQVQEDDHEVIQTA